MYLGITDFYKIRKKVAEIILPPEIGFLPPDPPVKISMIFTLLDKKVAVIILPPEVRVFAAGSAGKNINDFYPIRKKSCGNYFSAGNRVFTAGSGGSGGSIFGPYVTGKLRQLYLPPVPAEIRSKSVAKWTNAQC